MSTATVTINVRAATKQAASEIDKLKKTIANVTTTAGWKNLVTGVGVGAGISAYNALAGAIANIPSAAMGAVQAASDLAEAQNKVNVVFGQSAGEIERFAASAAKSMGASRTEALSAAGTFGNLFTTMGLGQRDAAAMSQQILQLAGDLASFNNIATSDALQKLRSGLVGEAEPLRSLGVQLTEAAVAAKAVEMGLAGTTASVSQAAKLQARYALILEQTTTAQGDYARTADGLANSQRTLAAEIDNLQASLGQKLEPAVRTVVSALANIAGSDQALAAVATVLGVTLVTAAVALAAALAPVVASVTAITGGLNLLIPLLVGAGIALSGTGKGAVNAASQVRDYGDAMRYAWRETKQFVEERRQFSNIRTENGVTVPPPTIDKSAFDKALESLREKGTRASQAVADGIKTGQDAVQGAWDDLVEKLKNPLTTVQRLAFLQGKLASKELANGLKSGDPYVRDAAVKARDTFLAEMDALTNGAWTAGANAAAALANGIELLLARARTMNEDISAAEIADLQRRASAWRKLKAEIEAAGNVRTNYGGGSGGGAAAAANDVNTLLASAKGAIAGLKGLGTTLRDLVSTFSSSWTPTVLTSAQASGALQAALGKVQTAVAGLKVGVESTRAAVANAFEAMRQAAANYFESVHRERLRDLADANSAIQSQLSAQIAAINAGLSAQRAAIEAARNARREADLREALANAQGQYSDPLQAQIAGIRDQQRLQARADEESRLKAGVSAARTRRDRAAAQDALDAFYERVRLEELEATYQQNTAIEDAQQNLSDFLADEALQRADTAAQARISALEAEKTHQQSLYDAQVESENARYAAQTAALDKMLSGLTTGLDAMKEVWTSKNKQVLALLKTYLGDFRSAGAAAAQAVADGIASVTIPAPVIPAAVSAAPTATKTTTSKTTATISGHRADGGPVYAGRTYVVGEQGPEYLTMGSQPGYVTANQSGPSGQPVVINLTLDGKVISRVVDEKLFYAFRTAARTGSAL